MYFSVSLACYWSKDTKNLVLNIENVFKSGDEDIVFLMLKDSLQKMTNYYAWKWNNYRISAADFESAFWGESWKVISDYAWRGGSGKFLLYETLVLAWNRQAIDVVKLATRTKKGMAFHTALPLSDYSDEIIPDTRVNIEEQVINKIMLEKFMKEVLNPKERILLQVLILDPLASLRELESIVGYSKDTVSRTLIRIAKKLVDSNLH